MAVINLPNNWVPRDYQMAAWSYLENGGRHCELVWPRRHGKDEVGLHRTAVAAFERVATYWYMLPLATQARKAIWDAINPHTGKRRIDEAFPIELRSSTRDHEMMIRFKNGSTWQVLGSDNFNSLVGSPPAGIVYSEWALSNPSARAYLRPIMMENGGWQIFNTTPRGKNHAYRTFNNAKNDKTAFAERLTATQTGLFSAEALERERLAYHGEYGEDAGEAFFEQEYMTSFDAAILGAIFGKEMKKLEDEGRETTVLYDETRPVNTAWDLGRSDHTAIWFYQMVGSEVHILDFHRSNLRDADFYIELLKSKRWANNYGKHNLPHDAKAKTLAAKGKSFEEQLAEYAGWGGVRIVPNLSIQDGYKAARAVLKRCWFDHCCNDDNGIEALKQYRYEWDAELMRFSTMAVHDWTSHPSDAFRMLAVAEVAEIQKALPPPEPKYPIHQTFDQLRNMAKKRNLQR